MIPAVIARDALITVVNSFEGPLPNCLADIKADLAKINVTTGFPSYDQYKDLFIPGSSGCLSLSCRSFFSAVKNMTDVVSSAPSCTLDGFPADTQDGVKTTRPAIVKNMVDLLLSSLEQESLLVGAQIYSLGCPPPPPAGASIL